MFDLLMGLVRWRYRVAVYVSLMRDEYPPFRLDLGSRWTHMTRRNPLFPYIYRLGMPIFDRLFYRRYRREAMSNATGRLLMVGLGPGTDLLFLPPAVTSVAAVEPEAAMRRMAVGAGSPPRHCRRHRRWDRRVDSVPGQQFRLGACRAGVVLGRRCGRYPRRDPAGARTWRQVGGPRACPRGRADGPVPGPDRQAVVLAGFRLRAEPPNHRRHCRGRIRYRGLRSTRRTLVPPPCTPHLQGFATLVKSDG